MGKKGVVREYDVGTVVFLRRSRSFVLRRFGCSLPEILPGFILLFSTGGGAEQCQQEQDTEKGKNGGCTFLYHGRLFSMTVSRRAVWIKVAVGLPLSSFCFHYIF